MITADARILENVKTSAEWAAANPVLPNRVKGYDSTVKHYKIGDGVTAWADLPFWEYSGSPVFSFYYLPNDPAVYNFSTEELATLNAFGRRPVLTASIYQAPGYVDSPDIVANFTGSPGFYTAGFIQFHPDDDGNNLDLTYVQFS